ncbi:MAG: 6-bladed beta-propeller [Acidobacteria bacterium]|nr:6-bladed beta-propeller [Acidobacteriota bacterium]MBE3129150.1 6-bladed beta-propeller [Acidobacteriota bacterium]
MKRVCCCLLGISFLVSCGGKQPQIDKVIEDGVEVVLNHINPYIVSEKPMSFRLEEELRIDLATEEFVNLGISFPDQVHVDSAGNIYIFDRQRKSEYFIFKFDKSGRFVRSMGRFGQGPGEIQGVTSIGINSRDEIWTNSSGTRKIVVYNREGNLIRESRYAPVWWATTLLENGGYIVLGNIKETSPAGTGFHLRLFDAGFHEVKLLDFYDMSRLRSGGRTTGLIVSLHWKVHKDRIFIGNDQRGYEILVYDLGGRLLRKIRKEYVPVQYPENFRKDTEIMAKRRPEIYAPDYTPPFNSFFIDDNGYLFVMTYEKGAEPDEYLHDIFNEESIFVGRVSLGLSGSMGRALNHMHAVAEGDRYYRMRFKEDDYPELIVYRMVWN